MSLPLHVHVIDDERSIRDACSQTLARNGCEVSLSASGAEAIAYLREHTADVVILDLHIPDIPGLDLLSTFHEKTPGLPIIVITGYPSVETAVTAMKLGAYDFIPKPFNPATLRATVSRAVKAHRIASVQSKASHPGQPQNGIESIIGVSPVMRALVKLIGKVAQSDCSVLITGETGTGKEVAARALHAASTRSTHPFIPVDAGGLVDTLIESELFGHVRGAFTGAVSDRTGRFELAQGGTLFLDEITNMDYRTQGKLLRVLQDREVYRVGSTKAIPVDVRIIAASNRNLLEEITMGNFRVDLFYRLNVIPITIPPLREHIEDIPVLAGHFLERFRCRKPSGYPERISDHAMARMLEYHWPGNVRELEHTMKRAVALCENRTVDPLEIHAFAPPVQPPIPVDAALDRVECEHIRRTLVTCRYNKTSTARMLGIDRKTLRSKIRKYHISDSTH